MNNFNSLKAILYGLSDYAIWHPLYAYIAPLKEEAKDQLLRYASDDIVTQSPDGAQLKLITVIFRGWEIVEMEETFA